MSNAVLKMKAKIKRKVKKNKQIKVKNGIEAILIDFLDKAENVCLSSTNIVDFHSNIEMLTNTLNRHVSYIDSNAEIFIKWSCDKEEIDWRDLKILAVQVKWSDAYLEKNPEKESQISIDIMRAFWEGISEDN